MEASEQDASNITLGDVAQGPQPIESVADILRAGYEQAKAQQEPKDMVLPGYGEPVSELHILFRHIPDYEELRNDLRKTLKKGMRGAALEMALGKETLRLASTGSYALVNGERKELGQPLGLALYAALGLPPGPQTDGEAIHLLFHEDTTVMMTRYAELDQWIRRGGREAEDELLGN